MPKVSAHSELMDNAVPAGPLHINGNFFVAEDNSGENMIFSTDTHGSLNLVLKGADGNNELIDLGAKFGLGEGDKVGCLALNQNLDHTIHLVFSVSNGNNASSLFVVEPMDNKRETWKAENLSSRLYTGSSGQWPIRINKFLLGSSDDSDIESTAYPSLYIELEHLDRGSEDIWGVSVDPIDRTWRRQESVELPFNAFKIEDKCIGNLDGYRGLFVLYRDSTSLRLEFSGLDPTDPDATLRCIIQKVPLGAKKIASFQNNQGLTDLLITGSEGLTYQTAQQCLEGQSCTPTLISTESAFRDVSQMFVAQTNAQLSLWTLNNDTRLSYKEMNISRNDEEQPQTNIPAIPLVEGLSAGSNFAALRNKRLGQRLFIADGDGKMKMLEQSIESAIWQPPAEIYIPESDKMIEFSSYTIQVSVEEDDGAPMANKSIKLSCSTSTEIIANGKTFRASPDKDQPVSTDEDGSLTIIIRSDTLSAPTITLKSRAIFSGGSLVIDPMSKMWSTIGSISSAKDLRAMKMPDGTDFVREGVTDVELGHAAEALKSLHGLRGEISESSIAASEANGWFDADRLWGALYFAVDLLSKAWDTIKKGVEVVKKGWNCLVEKVKEGWKFVLKIGEKAWDFVLQTATHIAAAVQTVLTAISRGWEWIKKKLAFIFSWGDIVIVKEALVNHVAHGLAFVAEGAPIVESKVQEYFAEMRTKVRSLKNHNLPPDIAKLKTGKNPEMEAKLKNSRKSNDKVDKGEKETETPQAQYVSYHLKQGSSRTKRQGQGNVFYDLVWPKLKGVWAKVENLFTQLWSNLKNLFDNPKNAKFEDLIANMGLDLLENSLDIIQEMITSFLGIIRELLMEITDSLSQEIQIPVISALYRKIAKGKMTILDVICLVIAVPATLVYKIVVGDNPAEIEGFKDFAKSGSGQKALANQMSQIRGGSGQFSAMAVSTQSRPLITNRTLITRIGDEKPDTIATDSWLAAGVSNSSSSDRPPGWPRGPAQKEFERSVAKVAPARKFLVPLGHSVWYNFNTSPKMFFPTDDDNGPKWKKYLSPTFKLVMWIAQFGEVGDLHDLLNMPKGLGDDDEGFRLRVKMWFFGGVSAFANFVSSRVGNITSVLMGGIQTLLLLQIQIEESEKYSTYLIFEEWTKLLGKILTSITMLMDAPVARQKMAIASLAMSNTGISMQFFRGIDEVFNPNKVHYTGIELP